VKLARLLLTAFGPFTETEIDFGPGAGPNLHFVYGLNEAGKSSALRGMSDLRFGISNTTRDNFLHEYNKMQVGGVFVDAKGNFLGYARRKRRANTLGRIDLQTAQITWDGATGVADELALTGGYSRAEFEQMFGLDHQRLRNGGEDLVRGHAELSGALFQASSGAANVKALLEALESDAKLFYNAHGRTQNAIVNEAKRQFEEQRTALRKAQIRPLDWQNLKRAHDTAAEALAAATEALKAARAEATDLSHLRAVAPIVGSLDSATRLSSTLESAVLLAPDAVAQRLGAERTLEDARRTREEAEGEIARCQSRLEEIPGRPQLLEIEDAIERFATAAEEAPQLRIDLQRELGAIESGERHLAELSAQIAPGQTPDDILRVAPGAPARSVLAEGLASVDTHASRLQDLQRALEQVDEDLDKTHVETFAVSIAERRELDSALHEAIALGEVTSRIQERRAEVESAQRELAQAMADLNAESEVALRRAIPLLPATISATKTDFDALETELTTLKDEDERLCSDLADLQLRLKELQAQGEIVTPDTLREAREHRDRGWNLIRRGYIDGRDDPAELGRQFHPTLPLATAFERAQNQSDNRADLLRADAARSAQASECTMRIAAMTQRQTEIQSQVRGVAGRRFGLEKRWHGQLQGNCLPRLTPSELENWQTRRLAALSQGDGLTSARGKYRADEAAAAAASARLEKANAAASASLDGAQPERAPNPPAAALPSLIRSGQDFVRRISVRETASKTQEATRKTHQAQRQRVESQIATAQTALNEAKGLLSPFKAQLRLPDTATAGEVRARLQELEAVANLAKDLDEARDQKARTQTKLDNITSRASEVAKALGDAVGHSEGVELFAARAMHRLREARAIAMERDGLTTDMKRAQRSLREAELAVTSASAELRVLCTAASVENPADLPQAETKSEEKRRAIEADQHATEQLAAATNWTLDEIRERLARIQVDQIPARIEEQEAQVYRLEQELESARSAEEQARLALQAVDMSDAAAAAREAMELAAARHRSGLRPWARLRLAHSLLREAMDRYGKRAQAPMLKEAQGYFALMTDNGYPMLATDEGDEGPVLKAQRHDGALIGIEALSEGTRDQLYLALRLAALDIRRTEDVQMPLVLDDVLITSDKPRSGNILRALAHFAKKGQVIVFTHHEFLIDLANKVLAKTEFAVHELGS
jgi:exonuclease SbcC